MSEPSSSPETICLSGGSVFRDGVQRRADVLINEGVIRAVEPDLEIPAGARVLDASDCVVGPGLVDLHTHLRQPGGEEAETIETGTRAAACGGYTAVVAMPNTTPPIDCADVVRELQSLSRGACAVVLASGAITVGRAGERLAPMAEMARLGVRLFTDDGCGVQDGALMRRALEYASGLRAQGFPILLAQHCEDDGLCDGGVMHEGVWSSRLGLPGAPAAAEEVMVLRDLALVRLTGAPMHFLHLSTSGSVEALRQAKADGLPVTAECTPHHLALSDAAIAGYDPVFKVNPPLRTPEDAAALRVGLADGTIDAIATDHAPHPPERKDLPFDQAPPGMLGLETALAIALADSGLPLERIFEVSAIQPARIAGLTATQGRPVAVGEPANLCVLDPEAEWEVRIDALHSRSRNSPYVGRRLRGQVRHTLLFGEPVILDAAPTR